MLQNLLIHQRGFAKQYAVCNIIWGENEILETNVYLQKTHEVSGEASRAERNSDAKLCADNIKSYPKHLGKNCTHKNTEIHWETVQVYSANY